MMAVDLRNPTRAAPRPTLAGDLWKEWKPNPGELLFKAGDRVRERTQREDPELGNPHPTLKGGVVLRDFAYERFPHVQILTDEGNLFDLLPQYAVLVVRRDESQIRRFPAWFSVGAHREEFVVEVHESMLEKKTPQQRDYYIRSLIRNETHERIAAQLQSGYSEEEA